MTEEQKLFLEQLKQLVISFEENTTSIIGIEVILPIGTFTWDGEKFAKIETIG